MPRSNAARLALAVLAVATLPACSGNLDWREINVAAGGFSVLLPGRPASETRTVRIGPDDLTLTILRVRVEPFLFGAGFAPLPAGADPQVRTGILESVVRDLAGNIGMTEQSVTAVEVTGHQCRDIEATGQVGTRALAMHARMCIDGRRLHQVVVVAPRERIGETDSDVFRRSLRFTE